MPKKRSLVNAGSSYNTWANALAKKWGISKRQLEQDDYDYKGFYKEYPFTANAILRDENGAHFPDTYKLPTHPTFSTESKYSGRNGNIVGGTWQENPNALQQWTYKLSPDQIKNNWNVRRTLEYAGEAEDNGFRLTDDRGRLPVIDGTIHGGVLPAVKVKGRKKYELGGGSVEDYESHKGNLVHIVSSGESLWKIAKDNNISLAKLKQYNPELKGDLIHPGDRLKISPEYRESIIDIREERNRENVINNDSFTAIQSAAHDSNYVVVDKKNKKLSIFDKNNNLLYSTSDISTGASGNDYNTITYVDEKGTIINNAGNNSTPAGISVITGQGTYHGFPSFTRGRINSNGSVEDIASSFHYGKTDKRNSSNGCVRIKGKTLEEMSNYIGQGTMVYTLPEQGGSRFSLKNGKLNFTADNPYGKTEGADRYWDDYNVRIDRSFSPLSIYYNGNNTDNEYNANVLNYVNSISTNKQALQKQFGLSSDEYNRLAELAVGIAQQESKYGTSDRYKLKKNAPDWLIDALKGGGNHARSRGLTQIKINGDNQEMRNIYSQLGINEESIKRPEISAIATMARLAYMYNSEVKGRKFKGAENADIDSYDALLYKYIGRNSELKNKTATPDKNNYINNVKRYSLEFGFLEPRQVEI